MIHSTEKALIVDNKMSTINGYLLPASSQKLREILENENILGLIKFSDNSEEIDFKAKKNGFPQLNVQMKPFLGDSYYEVWTSDKPVTYGSGNGLQYATDGFHQFLAVGMKEENKGLREIGRAAYDAIFDAVAKNDYSDISRVWNYIPNINEHVNDTERYIRFCQGRAESFQKNSEIFPAATGIGCWGDSVCIYMISTRNSINQYIENPNQTPAYKYPPKYGIKSPSFARATYSGDKSGEGILYVSGTASILGHETAHIGDVKKQCETAIENVRVLISSSNLSSYGIKKGYTLDDLDCIKVYIKNDEDFEAVKDICTKIFSPQKPIAYLKADICRKNLLVELEGVVMGDTKQHKSNEKISYSTTKKAKLGKWTIDMDIPNKSLKAGDNLPLNIKLNLSADMLKGINKVNAGAKSLLLLLSSERCFDAEGLHHIPLDEKMSTLLTPAGLAIEGGSAKAISKHTGSRYRNPIDKLIEIPLSELQRGLYDNSFWLERKIDISLSDDIPPGVYRIRIDLGITDGINNTSLNMEEFGGRAKNEEHISLVFTPPFGLSGQDVNGNWVDANSIEKRLYWVLLNEYKSNGYYGVVANEDKSIFALSNRNIIPDDVILPLYDVRGNKKTYNLEPAFATDLVDRQRNIPFNYSSGQLSLIVIDPDGLEHDLGYGEFTDNQDGYATTGKPSFTQWTPKGYGRYKVIAKGWIEDIWGNRYYGGGDYEFWIAKRITFGTSTFMGMPFKVGFSYGAEIGFAPAVPADVNVKVSLYVDSDHKKMKSSTSVGKADSGGMFSAAHGMKKFPFDEPGEYHAQVRATYTDDEGHLWVCALTHAGVVHSGRGPLIAHGKKLKENICAFTTNSLDEEASEDFGFPYNYGEVLLIPCDGYGINKIEPVLTYEIKGRQVNTDYEEIGASNVKIKASNDLCPHIYPEYITDWAYYYAAAARPGLSARFMVAEDGVHEPSLPISATDFGGQVGASNNGNTLGTAHRLLGGVVLRNKNEKPLYGDYISNAFTVSKGSNPRVIKAGEEPLVGAKGFKFRYFIISHRPGLLYEQGYMFWPYLQMDPIVPAKILYSLTYPDGSIKSIEGMADNKLGYFMGSQKFALDQTGIYFINFESEWNGYKGSMPGMPKEGGYIFVYEKEKPSNFSHMKLNLKKQQRFDIEEGLKIQGYSGADKVYYTSVTPGALVEQGELPVENGCFNYHFLPELVNSIVPIYDVKNVLTGRKETGRIVQLTFFSPEVGIDGKIWHSFTRVIIRGTMAFNTYAY